MKLKSLETNKVTSLLTLTSDRGPAFQPDILKFVINRYNFQGLPDKLTDQPIRLQIGSWEGRAIDELSVYTDGIIVSSRCPSDIIDAFSDDLLSAVKQEFDVREVGLPTDGRSYESNLVVEFPVDASSKIDFLNEIGGQLSRFQRDYGLGEFSFAVSALQAAVDATAHTGRRPAPFILIRRVNMPYAAGLWFSTAPLKTVDHITILESLEKLMA